MSIAMLVALHPAISALNASYHINLVAAFLISKYCKYTKAAMLTAKNTNTPRQKCHQP